MRGVKRAVVKLRVEKANAVPRARAKTRVKRGAAGKRAAFNEPERGKGNAGQKNAERNDLKGVGATRANRNVGR